MKANSQQTVAQDSTTVPVENPSAIDAVKNFFKNFQAQDTTGLKESMLLDLKLTSMQVDGKERKISTI